MAGSLQGKVREQIDWGLQRYREFREGLDPRQERLFHAFVFLSRFAALAVPFYLIIASGWEAEGFRAFTAQVSASTLQMLGIEATSTGSFVQAGELLVDVTRDSTGWKSVAVFTALVAASRRSTESKVKGVLIGVFLLLGVNLLRITSMVYAVETLGIDYEFLHTFLWRWGLTAAVIGLWALWMHLSTPSEGFIRHGR